jgi:hypothetical protein
MRTLHVHHTAGWLLLSTLLAGCGGPTPTPTAFVPFGAKDRSFSIEYPKGWEIANSGARPDGMGSNARFVGGRAQIAVETDVAGSLMSGIGAGPVTDPNDNEPLRFAHQQKLDNIKEDYSSYSEDEPKAIQTGMGPGMISEFKANGGLHGYHLTILNSNRRVTVLCQCPEGEWKRLKPSFDRVIQSVKR